MAKNRFELIKGQIQAIESALFSITGRRYFGSDGDASNYGSNITNNLLQAINVDDLFQSIPEQSVWDQVETNLGYDLKSLIETGQVDHESSDILWDNPEEQRTAYSEGVLERIILNESQKSSILTHANAFAVTEGYSDWNDMVSSGKIDFSKVIQHPVYDPEIFSSESTPTYYLPRTALDNGILSDFKTYLQTQLGDLSGFYTLQNINKYQREEFRSVDFELRTGSTGNGFNVSGNSVEILDTITLPTFGDSLIQSVKEGSNKSFKLRFKMIKEAISVGTTLIGLGKPTSNAVNQIRYFIGFTHLSNKVYYGANVAGATQSAITHDNSYWYEIGYDGDDVWAAYSDDNCATWTEINRYVDAAGSFPIRCLIAGEMLLGLGKIDIVGIHVNYGFEN